MEFLDWLQPPVIDDDRIRSFHNNGNSVVAVGENSYFFLNSDQNVTRGKLVVWLGKNFPELATFILSKLGD